MGEAWTRPLEAEDVRFFGALGLRGDPVMCLGLSKAAHPGEPAVVVRIVCDDGLPPDEDQMFAVHRYACDLTLTDVTSEADVIEGLVRRFSSILQALDRPAKAVLVAVSGDGSEGT